MENNKDLRAGLFGDKKANKEYKMSLKNTGYVPVIRRSGAENIPALVAIDTGSSELRGEAATPDLTVKLATTGVEDKYTVIPTRCAMSNVTAKGGDSDFSLPKPLGRDMELYNSMDTVLVPISNSDMQPIRMVRGESRTEYGSLFPNSSITSTLPKHQDDAYIRTTLDGVGYTLFDQYERQGLEIPKSFNVVLTISVRPHEANADTEQTLSDKLKGTYEWTVVRYSDKFGYPTNSTIKFTIKEVLLTSEGEIQVKQAYRLKPMPRIIIGVSTGGSNISTEGFKFGKLQQDASLDLNLTGNAFAAQIAEMATQAIRNKLDAPSYRMSEADVYKLITKGIVNVKGKTYSFDKIVTAQKEAMGTMIESRLNDILFTRTDYSIATADAIIFLGNLCKRSEYYKYTSKPGWESPNKLFDEKVEYYMNNAQNLSKEELSKLQLEIQALDERRRVEEPSIMDTVIKLLNAKEKNAQVSWLEENLIPLGNLMHAIEFSTNTDIVNGVLGKLMDDNKEYFEKWQENRGKIAGEDLESQPDEASKEPVKVSMSEPEELEEIIDIDVPVLGSTMSDMSAFDGTVDNIFDENGEFDAFK